MKITMAWPRNLLYHQNKTQVVKGITKVQTSASLLVFFGNEEMVTHSQIPESGILMAYISDPI